MTFARSPHLVCYWDAGGGLVYDYATGVSARLSALTWRILDACSEPRTIDDLSRVFDVVPRPSLQPLVEALLAAGYLCDVDGAVAAMSAWGGWNPAAGFFHTVSRQCTYGDPDAFDAELAAKAAHTPMPRSVRPPATRRIPLPAIAKPTAFARASAERRTWRQFGRKPVTLEALATLLEVSCAITHWHAIPGLDAVPLTSSPSAGGRHPIDTYVLNANIDGLEKGIHRYAADRHELEPIDCELPPLPSLFPSQPWFGSCSAAVFFAAVFSRTQWRYDFARAYRAVLIEAGHICQTFLLAATEMSLASFCTMAIDEHAVEQALGLDGVTEAIVYAAGVGTLPRLRDRVVMPPDSAPARVTRNVFERRRVHDDSAIEIANVTVRLPHAASIPVDEDAYSNKAWQRSGSVRSVACLPLSLASGTVQIEVRLTASTTPTVGMSLTATVLDGAAVIGPLPVVQIAPADWHNGHCTKSFTTPASALFARGVGETYVALQWNLTAAQPQTLEASEHLLFVTVAPPQDPWTTTAGDPERSVPSARALGFACLFADTALTEADVPAALVATMAQYGMDVRSSPPRFKFAPDDSSYLGIGLSVPQLFQYDRLLQDFFGASLDPIALCCTEAAAVVVVFGNVLGCQLMRVRIDRSDCQALNTTPVRALGCGTTPSTYSFPHHDVAAPLAANTGPTSAIYDALLVVDADTQPDNPPHQWSVVSGMHLGGIGVHRGSGAYLPQLLKGGHIVRELQTHTDVPRVVVSSVKLVDVCGNARLMQILEGLPAPDFFKAPGLVTIPSLVQMTSYAVPVVTWPASIAGVEQTVTLFGRPGTATSTVKIDVWTGVGARTVWATILAMNEATVTVVHDAPQPTYLSSSGHAVFLFANGSGIRVLRLSDEAPQLGDLIRSVEAAL